MSRDIRLGFTRAEWLALAGCYGVIAILHLCGWGLLLHYSRSHPMLLGMGFTAYLFGLRHAFDADHITAVDDTVRYLMERGSKPLGIGFFFSLGHSTMVLVMALAAVFAAATVRQHLPQWRDLGALIGGGISGGFLWLIGSLNLVVLLKILKTRRTGAAQRTGHVHLEALLRQRGFFNRLLGGWTRRLIHHSWQMYPLGLLFGLGFDTASEVGLLALAAGAAAGQIPPGAIIALPVMFAAGMSAIDTTDGVLMVKAYDWALVHPTRRIFYNIAITSVSVAVALIIGSLEWLQVMSGVLHLKGGFWAAINHLDFALLGYLVVGLFLSGWAISILVWKAFRMEARSAALG